MVERVVIAPVQQAELPDFSNLFSEIVSGLSIYSAAARKSNLAEFALPRLEERLAEDPRALALARLDGRPVGFYIAEDQSGPIWLDWYGVHESARGHGIGRGLLQHLLAEARRRGAFKIWCDSRVNNVASNALLRAEGFVELCRLDRHWHGHDFILWERMIEQSASMPS